VVLEVLGFEVVRMQDANDTPRNDATEKQAVRERVEQLLLAGLDSGPPIEAVRDWWLQKADEWAKKYAEAATESSI
jgi:hypothetical protein